MLYSMVIVMALVGTDVDMTLRSSPVSEAQCYAGMNEVLKQHAATGDGSTIIVSAECVPTVKM
ncbi:MAG: hypothetical protein E6Q24_14895 [Chitinophagaceae bacterium]|nr:MAG: hypothetical protein E6Q24_14895 [Chitinophagaceae bacterium]